MELGGRWGGGGGGWGGEGMQRRFMDISVS